MDEKRLNQLFAVPLKFAQEKETEALLLLIVQQAQLLIPAARNTGLLLSEGDHSRFQLRAQLPGVHFNYSETLARKALRERDGLRWQRRPSASPRNSRALNASAGIVVPLTWQEQTLGVLWCDNGGGTDVFLEEDLRCALLLACYAASALVEHHRQSLSLLKSQVLERLLTNFSPRAKTGLLARAEEGRLHLGGESAAATVLCADLRGFNRVVEGMESVDVMNFLNDYFPPLIEAVLRYDGTICKFTGDSILVVFGSPEPVPQHQEKAVLAAVAMQAVIQSINERRRAANVRACEMGIGLHTGEVVHGFVGTRDILQYTVVGSTMNQVGRYCAGARGMDILLSPSLYAAVSGSAKAERVVIPTPNENDVDAYRLIKWR